MTRKWLEKWKSRLRSISERVEHEKLRKNLMQAIPFWIASIVTGLVAVLYARLFAMAESLSKFIMEGNEWNIFIITPVSFLLAWWLVKKFAPYSKGSGIPQVMAAIELSTPQHSYLVKKLLSLRIIVIKVFSSIVMVLGGGVIGREGPTIQIAGSVFNFINTILPDWWPKVSRKNVILAGAASGLAAAFNTPLGGIVFAIEELVKTHISYFKSALFTAVIIAGLAAQALAGPYLYLGYPELAPFTFSVFGAVILVSLIAGLSGGLMGKAMLWMLGRVAALKKQKNKLLFVLLAPMVIATAGFFLGHETMGSGKEIMTRTLFTEDKDVAWYVPILRINGLIFSFSTGAAGGIFAPSLSAGAAVGAAIASWFDFTNGHINLLILSGMVAFLTGVTRSPFTSSIIVLEMTDRHNVIFHLMMAGLVASFVAALVDRHSIYHHLKLNYLRELEPAESLPSDPAGRK